MKTRILTTLILAVTALTSCIYEFPVTDYSFDFSGTVVYDAEADQHRLTLTCNKRSCEETYNVVFHVDGENVITLTDMEGQTYNDWFKASFSDTDSRTYILSEASVGSHLIQITISTEGFCQSLEVPYEVTRQKYDIHAEVSTVGTESSSVLMSLTKGDPKHSYDVDIHIDGESHIKQAIDFSGSPICTIALPKTLRPHEHSLTLYVSDGMTAKQYDIDFQEPIRHPEIPITLSHDKTTGYHVATIGYNPYGIRIDFGVFLELTGESSFYHEEEDFWWRRPEHKYITEKDERTLSEAGSECSVNLTDRDGIAKKITSQWETSYIWASHSTPGGGEDSGEDYSYISGSQPAFYHICKEVLTIDITGENVPGITLKVTNEIGKMTLNGKESTSGTTSITL
jgi:hypothetical protein